MPSGHIAICILTKCYGSFAKLTLDPSASIGLMKCHFSTKDYIGTLNNGLRNYANNSLTVPVLICVLQIAVDS